MWSLLLESDEYGKRSSSNKTGNVQFNGQELWQILPAAIRNSESFCHIKANIKELV